MFLASLVCRPLSLSNLISLSLSLPLSPSLSLSLSPSLSLSLSYRSSHPQSVGDSAAGGVFKPHIDQSRPSAKDEEELQLQLALRMSKEQADEEEKLR